MERVSPIPQPSTANIASLELAPGPKPLQKSLVGLIVLVGPEKKFGWFLDN